MTFPFNHEEFIHMMEQYKLESTQITVPANTILNDLALENKDCLYLLKIGIIAGYIDYEKNQIYSIFNDNFFMGYYTIFDNRPFTLLCQTLTECEIVIYQKKDIEFALSLFPENFSFQYTIMKTIAMHAYYKSLLQYQNKKNQLAFAFETIVNLLNIDIIDGVATLPKSITTTLIKNYCTLSKAFFYSQLKELNALGIITKVDAKWQINMIALCAKNDRTR
ncbi:Crp/Fnr family transcriptional regulator [Listeria sp. FSL L7-1485]|uniref:Crp/Fnr family transcriptional regulator n=1 Tax=Listeria immobilis TaxID=2713502 RepID=A0A7X0X997_9LIST|nr:Crp/Fnr family transcriptional regulator [Listeria immobilis]MBC1483186.1 Crp/Fnr family transcriptional regulator [Listeria immobilis]MBC1489969.1 Crp/Fnr family transcriptional regulator [Listeria immobilis]MBC1505960.1 Crp/Fnr family transcriptional regulator [Listeria immobilis]MBC1508604.1 Crp/Fnr family transcriptional regulator [Listeria immobilis]MBC1537041.1 Crp/Fnr family transcriptional regulator [Listeria immobilis]